MTVIDFPVQQTLPGLWWANPEKWEDYSADEIVQRATEIEAIKRIRRQAKALHNTRYRTVLTPLEKQLLDLELLCIKRNAHLDTPLKRYTWIATQVRGIIPYQVKGILDEVTQIQRDWIAMEGDEKRQIAQYKKTRRLQAEFKQLVFEVMLEKAA